MSSFRSQIESSEEKKRKPKPFYDYRQAMDILKAVINIEICLQETQELQ